MKVAHLVCRAATRMASANPALRHSVQLVSERNSRNLSWSVSVSAWKGEAISLRRLKSMLKWARQQRTVDGNESEAATLDSLSRACDCDFEACQPFGYIIRVYVEYVREG